MQEIDIDDTLFNITADRLILPIEIYAFSLIATILYCALFHLTNNFIHIPAKTINKKFDVITRFISGLYAGTFFIFSIFLIIYGDSKCGYYNTELLNRVISFSFGFYTTELIHIYLYNLLDTRRLIHHILVLVAEYECLILKSGDYLIIRWAL